MSRRGLTCLVLLSLLAAPPLRAADPDGSVVGRLRSVAWEFGVWGRTYVGTACWLDGEDGRWRLEVATGEGVGTARLLDQSAADGWTVLAVDAGQAYLQPWRDKLETLGPERAARVLAILRLAAGGTDLAALDGLGVDVSPGPAARPPRLPWGESRNGSSTTLRLEWRPGDCSDLRTILETRGRGRGGAGETWRVDDGPDGEVRIASSRRAGRLFLRPLPSRPVRYQPDEVFVPIWTLGEVLDLD